MLIQKKMLFLDERGYFETTFGREKKLSFPEPNIQKCGHKINIICDISFESQLVQTFFKLASDGPNLIRMDQRRSPFLSRRVSDDPHLI